MDFPHLLFKDAGLNATDVANLIGVSRVTGHRWLNGGRGVNIFLQEKVKKVIPPLTKAVKSGALPNPDILKLPPAKRVTRIRSILRKNK